MLGPGVVLGGSYRLLRPMDGGGMGDLFLAAHERVPMKVVVKVLSPALIAPEALAQFRTEAMVLAKLQHPNIVQLIDFDWTESGLPFLVMEYLPGRDLAAAFHDQRALGFGHAMALIQQIACGLHGAHSRGVVHRDLKPKNVMVVPCEGRRDIVKLIDFGVSSHRHLPAQPDQLGVAGTPEFMAPEQAAGRREVGPAADQFSLAVIAYLLVTGRLPWIGSSALQVLEQVMHARPHPIEQGMPAVETVLLRGMAKRPEHRYASTLALVRALRRAMAADGLLGESANPHTGRARDEGMLAPPAQLEDPTPARVAQSATTTAQPVSSEPSAAPAPRSEASGEGSGEGSGEDGSRAANPVADTVRIPTSPYSYRAKKWLAVVVGAIFGAGLALAGPALFSARAAVLWNRVQGGATHAAGTVIGAMVDEGRQVGRHVVGLLSSR